MVFLEEKQQAAPQGAKRKATEIPGNPDGFSLSNSLSPLLSQSSTSIDMGIRLVGRVTGMTIGGSRSGWAALNKP